MTSGNLTIKNTGDASTASVFANSGPAIYFNGSALTITGGNFESGGHPHAIELGTSAASLSISGGYFACSGDFVHKPENSDATIELTGGTFLYDGVYEYCPDGYYPVMNLPEGETDPTYTVRNLVFIPTFTNPDEFDSRQLVDVKGIVTHTLNDVSLTDDQRLRVASAEFSLYGNTTPSYVPQIDNSVTYDVYPSLQFKDSSGNTIGGVNEIYSNQFAEDATFNFKLSVAGLTGVTEGSKVRITHKLNDGSEEKQIATVDSNNNVTVTGITSFSDFILEPTNDQALATYGYTIALQDSIDIVFNVKKLAYTPSDYTIEYTFKGQSSGEIHLTDQDLNTFTVAECAAKEMTDKVTVSIKYGTTEIDSFTLSIKDYCNQVFDKYGHTNDFKTTNEKARALVQLCEATLDYGTQAQKKFNYKTDDLANPGTAYFSPDDITVPQADFTLESNCPGITDTTFSLVTTSKTEFVIFLKHDASLSLNDFKFVLDDEVLTGVTDLTTDNKFKIVISGISARNLGQDHTLVVTSSDESVSGTYSFVASPIDYMATAVSNNVQVNLNKAFYNYYLKADAYFSKKMQS